MSCCLRANSGVERGGRVAAPPPHPPQDKRKKTLSSERKGRPLFFSPPSPKTFLCLLFTQSKKTTHTKHSPYSSTQAQSPQLQTTAARERRARSRPAAPTRTPHRPRPAPATWRPPAVTLDRPGGAARPGRRPGWPARRSCRRFHSGGLRGVLPRRRGRRAGRGRGRTRPRPGPRCRSGSSGKRWWVREGGSTILDAPRPNGTPFFARTSPREYSTLPSSLHASTAVTGRPAKWAASAALKDGIVFFLGCVFFIVVLSHSLST